MHRKHRGSGDDVERGSSGRYAENILQQKTTKKEKTTQ